MQDRLSPDLDIVSNKRGQSNSFTRTPFPNNTIPAAAFNSVGKSLVALYPTPNLPGAGNNFNFSALQNTSLDTATFRGDVQVTAKDSMFGRMSFNHGGITVASTLSPPADPIVVERLPAWNVLRVDPRVRTDVGQRVPLRLE